MSDAPAGWYPDPTPATSEPTLRYWDGQTWTEHVAAAVQPAAPAYPTGPTHPGAAAYPGATATPYVPTYSGQPAGPTTPDGEPLAGWWARVGAHILDLLIVGIVGSLITLPSQISMNSRMNDLAVHLEGDQPDFEAFWSGYLDVMQDMMLWQLPAMALALVYTVGLLRWKGATVGKLALGLKVRLRDQPGQLPWRAIAWRVAFQNLGVITIVLLALGAWQVALGLLPVVWLIMVVDVLRPLWNKKRQALHDAVARTNVVKVR